VPHIIEFKNVYKSFSDLNILKGLNLTIPQGLITFIIGRSGEGKSVIAKHIMGLLRPDQGNIFVDGHCVDGHTGQQWNALRIKMGFLFQDGALFDSLSVYENVGFTLFEHTQLSPSDIDGRIKNLLKRVDFEDAVHKSVSELSIGQRKRVGLARALALDPKILLYDEPTTGMDPLISEHIDQLIRVTQQDIPGVSTIVISHDVRSILTLAQHIIFLNEGTIYAQGPAEFFRASTDPVIRQFLTGSPKGPLAKPLT